MPQQDHYLIFTNDLDRSLQQYYLNQLFPLCSNYVAIFVGKDENYRFIIASNNDSRELLNKLKSHFEIKGGGKSKYGSRTNQRKSKNNTRYFRE